MTAKLESVDPLICVSCRTRLDIGTTDEEMSSKAKRQKFNSGEIGLNESLSSGVCPICLDVLNPEFVDEISSTILTDFTQQKYDTTTYSISTIIPFSIWIREYLTLLSQGREFIFQDRKTALKRQLKNIYSSGIAKCSNIQLRYVPVSNLEIQMEFSHQEADKQLSQLSTLLYPINEQNNFVVTFATVERILLYNNLTKFRDLNVFPLRRVGSQCKLTRISYLNAPLYLAGRYNKYSRNISQTPWCLGEDMILDSVEDIISTPVMKIFTPSEIRFTASGREDIDVRMLGTGRPFLLELLNPKRTSNSKAKCKQIENEINEDKFVNISHFTTAAKSHTTLIKTGEESMNKTYRAVIYSQTGISEKQINILNGTRDIKLEQRTPIRVLHRRSLATRDKIVYTMSAKLRDNGFVDINLVTQSGTYIKEFVHGDMGRTQPNLRELLGIPDLDIIELDVLNVALEWPVSK
ncbi:hypothetical protein LOD99_14030 [Oopsacas minuta]|uniref:tRNA pseudouridine(55) synthase n=1 Tax=Oopsacas minuta TaxID=111878 RepID=A0AAV7KIQ0_9METZ|nr:hypothetical protein LOD99_14030 [Oopsacas minuta]